MNTTISAGYVISDHSSYALFRTAMMAVVMDFDSCDQPFFSVIYTPVAHITHVLG